MAGPPQHPSGMRLAECAENMLLTFASGALTGVACLTVLRKHLRRDKEVSSCSRMKQQTVADSFTETQLVIILTLQAEADAALHVDNGACLTPRGTPGQRGRECSVGGAPIFPSAGPLQHAGDVIHQLKSARAAASASVADFKTNLVTLQHLVGGTRAVSGEGAPACDNLTLRQSDQQQDTCCHSHKAAAAELQEAKQEALQLQNQLVQALAQLDVQRVELQQDASCIQACVTVLTRQVSAAGLQHSAAEDQLQVLQTSVQSLERQLHKAQTKQQHQQLQKTQLRVQKQQQQLQKAQKDTQQQQELLQQAHDSLAATQKENQQLQQQHEAACQQLLLLKQEHIDSLDEARQDKLQLRQAQEEAQAQLQKAAVSIASLRQQLEAAVAEAAASKLALSSAVSGVVATNQQLQQQSQAQQDLQNALLAAVTVSEASYQQVGQLVAEVQQLQQQQQDMRAAERAMQLELHAANKCAAGKTALVQQLELQLIQLQDQLHQQQAASSDAADLQERLQAVQAAASDYKQQLAVAQADLQAQVQAAEHHSRLQQQQLAQLQVQLDAALAQLAEADQQVQGLQATAEARLDMLEAREAQLADMQQQLEDLRASAAPAVPSQSQSLAVPASRLTPLGVLEASAGPVEPQLPLLRSTTAGKSEQELMQSYAGLINATRRGPTGTPHTLLIDDSLAVAIASSCSTAAADGSGAGQQRSWLQAHAAAEAPTSNLLAELQHESDELTEQLAKLQQYLKTSTSSYADLNSIEVMDEGLQVLRKLTDEAVTVAASTVQRVTVGGGAHSAPTSLAGRSPSLLGFAPKHTSCAGALAIAVPEPAVPSAAAAPAVSSVAMRRLGLNLPRLQTWGSGATLPGQHLPLSAVGTETCNVSDSTAAGASPAGNGNRVEAAELDLQGCTLDHWGSELSEAACSWLTGDLHEEPPASSSSTPTASFLATTAAMSAARLPSRLAAASIAAAAAGAEPGMLDAWGSGMLPASGAGSAMQEQQLLLQQQQHPASGQSVQTHQLHHSHPAAGSAQPMCLQEQLACALAEVRQLHGERLMLHSQVGQLAELAAQQEDRLAVNDELLTALTMGMVDEG